MNQSDAKSQKYFAVSRAILEIIEKEGEENVTHSRIARLSQVSRPWIYEYMGREKEDLIDVAAEVFGSFFARASTTAEPHNACELKALLLDGQEIAFQNIKAEPVIIKLYYRFRGTTNPIGLVIKKYEKHWLDVMSENLMRILNFDDQKALNISRAILTLRLGFYHRVATSSEPDNEIALAKKALDLIHAQIF